MPLRSNYAPCASLCSSLVLILVLIFLAFRHRDTPQRPREPAGDVPDSVELVK
jgi:hypothetical protein